MLYIYHSHFLVLAAYKHADGKKIDGRRVLVDVERGRTVKGWRPRRLGKWFEEVFSLCFKTIKKSFIITQDPVVQSIVSLTISLRHKFVKQISAKVTNTLLFFVEKM